ncbi:hypothetical protein [Verminephrobacter eiseniae]|uniref:hypothetical protein n=1 Tax=Verminephrobacter eiseniae TaxID=364317 RepID=UPI0022379673|nr:hypothetical protein [Verminephrobacter eiseniae]MCW5238186.1 hypothetical protein [Verminephrobacter eiseniae]
MEPADTLRFALHDRIHDAEVGPAHVPLALLGEFQKDVSEFLRGSRKEIDPAEVPVAIGQGSLVIAASGLLAAASLWADVAQLQNPSALGLIDPKRAAVVERWQAAARRNPHRSYRVVGKDGTPVVRVSAESDFRNQIEAIWVAVEKYVEGMVVDWGGASKANVHVRVQGGKVLIIATSQQLLADEERNRLYRPALLRVSAEENLKTGDLRNLNLLSFEADRPGWDEAAFNELVQKGTQDWGDAPDNWLEELRSGNG